MTILARHFSVGHIVRRAVFSIDEIVPRENPQLLKFIYLTLICYITFAIFNNKYEENKSKILILIILAIVKYYSIRQYRKMLYKTSFLNINIGYYNIII